MPTSVGHEKSVVSGGGQSNSNLVFRKEPNAKTLPKKHPPKVTKRKKSSIPVKKTQNVCGPAQRDIRDLLPSQGVKPELDEVGDSNDRVKPLVSFEQQPEGVFRSKTKCKAEQEYNSPLHQEPVKTQQNYCIRSDKD